MSVPSAAAPAPRLDSIDLLRGLVMVVMALDHTRDFFHNLSLQGVDPLDLTKTTPALFFTRWITHYCAPLFSFLAGTGVFLAATRGKSKRELSWFLLTRGLWLVILEFTYVRWAWSFNYDLSGNWGLVLWALGCSMILLAALVHLPLPAVAAFAILMIAGHNALDGIKPASFGHYAWLWHVLHVPGTFNVTAGYTFFAFYPLVPWVGVMAAGYAFGPIIQLPAEARRSWLLRLGLGLTAAFVVLRYSNLYGDPGRWTAAGGWRTIGSFLDCEKYPPSLLYLLMTIGPGILLLAAFDRGTPGWLKPVLVFGRVPFFYYMLHVPLIHGMAFAMHSLRHGQGNLDAFGATPVPAGAGVGLPLTYLAWLAAVALLYFPCRWFADYKRRHRDIAWLSYF